MRTDRIQVNTLERAASTDIMDLQAMQARQLGDVVKWLTAARWLDPGPIVSTLNDAKQPIIGGLALTYVSPTELKIEPGFLIQAFPSALSQGPLDSDATIGFLRSALTLALPPVGSRVYGVHYDVLSARVSSVVIETATVDIFDVPTQTFIPQNKNKKIEQRIEFQWTQGTANSGLTSAGMPGSNVPSLELIVAAGWVPIALVNVPAPGPRLEVFYLGRRLQDVIGTSELSPARSRAIATEYSAKLQTVDSPHHPVSSKPTHHYLTGYVRGSIENGRANLSTLQENSPAVEVIDDGSTFTVSQLQHLYLCPLKAGNLIMPVRPRSLSAPSPAPGGLQQTTGLHQGLVVRSSTQPTWDFRNGTALKLGGPLEPGNVWINQPQVEIGEALYIGSGYSSQSLSTRWRPMVHGHGGVVRFQLGEAHDGDDLPVPADFTAPLLLTVEKVVTGSSAFADAYELDLRTKVPRCASHVILQIESSGADTALDWLMYEIRQHVTGAGETPSGYPNLSGVGQCLARRSCKPAAGDSYPVGIEIIVPVGWTPYPSGGGGDATAVELGYHLRLKLLRATDQAVGSTPRTHVYLTGWIL